MKTLSVLSKGSGADRDQVLNANIPIHGILKSEGDGSLRFMSPWGFLTTFPLLPAATATGTTEQKLITLGTGTEVIARAAKGGVNVKTQATTPADNDNAMLIGVSGLYSVLTTNARTQIRFATRVNLSQITELQFGAGLDENLTSPIGSATAGDGCQFIFNPADEGGIIAGQAGLVAANFILASKASGADTFQNSGVRVDAGRDYDLAIEIGSDLKPRFYIDGVLVGTGAAVATAKNLGAVIGVQINAASPAGQKDFDVRFVSMEKSIG